MQLQIVLKKFIDISIYFNTSNKLVLDIKNTVNYLPTIAGFCMNIYVIY